MSHDIPYIMAPGKIEIALQGIKKASVPPKVTQDFVKQVIGIKGGTGDQVTSYLKKLGFAASDGTPTEAYKKYRNDDKSGAVLAEAIKIAYSALYEYNENAHTLSKSEIEGLIKQITGKADKDTVVIRGAACFMALVGLSDFEATQDDLGQNDDLEKSLELPFSAPKREHTELTNEPNSGHSGLGLNLGYTINLNLPATTDPAVFNAIFKSLKEHLLRADDV